MAKAVCCRDLGLDCRFVVYAPADDTVVRIALAHLRAVHAGQGGPEAAAERVREAVREA